MRTFPATRERGSSVNRPDPQMDAALRYAAHGWPIFPARPGNKEPAIPAAHPAGDPCKGECGHGCHGCHDATTDAEKIRFWWRDGSRNGAIATGGPGLTVLAADIAHGKPGFASLNKAIRSELAPPKVLIRTPSGGTDLYFQADA
jgi:hypothetical protein